MERYLGIDMHRDSCTAVVLSAGGKKTDQRVVPTEAAALSASSPSYDNLNTLVCASHHHWRGTHQCQRTQ